MREYYVKHGFLDADVRLETRGTDKDPVNYLVFHVVEQQRVIVAARSYPCLREADVKKLSEGGPTSAKEIGSEIDSYLQEELPGGEVLVPPDPKGLDQTIARQLGTTGARPAPLEIDPDRRVRARDVRARRPARAGALSLRGLPRRAGRGRSRCSAAAAIRARRRASAARCASRESAGCLHL